MCDFVLSLPHIVCDYWWPSLPLETARNSPPVLSAATPQYAWAERWRLQPCVAAPVSMTCLRSIAHRAHLAEMGRKAQLVQLIPPIAAFPRLHPRRCSERHFPNERHFLFADPTLTPIWATMTFFPRVEISLEKSPLIILYNQCVRPFFPFFPFFHKVHTHPHPHGIGGGRLMDIRT